MRYRIIYSPEVEDHLRALTKRERNIVQDEVVEHLRHQPDVETRNRKPMRPNPVAPWELRIGNLRVYYDIIPEEAKVLVLAVGTKERNRVRIGKEIVEL